MPLIEATYTLLTNVLDDKLEEARTQKNLAAIARCEERKAVHDSAYFILAWGQLEAKINDECVNAIAKRKASPDWETRRAWDARNEHDLRARFEDRVALLLDRTNSASTAFRDTMRLYGARNRVAHGQSIASGLDVPALIAQFYQIASELKP